MLEKTLGSIAMLVMAAIVGYVGWGVYDHLTNDRPLGRCTCKGVTNCREVTTQAAYDDQPPVTKVYRPDGTACVVVHLREE